MTTKSLRALLTRHLAFSSARQAATAAKLLTKDEARRITANVAKLPDLLGAGSRGNLDR